MKRGARSRDKLEEARFFFDHLAPNFGKMRKFDYFLSAFISDARSVAWVMVSEFSKVAGWEEWWAAQQPQPTEQAECALLKGTNALRIRAVKTGTPQTLSALAISEIPLPVEDVERVRALMEKTPGREARFRVTETLESSIVEMDIGGETIRFAGAQFVPQRELHEFPEQNVIEVCERYLMRLTALVQACEERFAP